ncbi:MAG: hypothetical protein ACTHOM_05040 [Allomuricauda sp.]
MLLKETSVLRSLPQLEEKQLLILDSLRFTIDMIDYTYKNLQNSILAISKGKKHKIHPPLFHYTWSLLDNIRRFIRIYKVLSTDKNPTLLAPIEYVNSPRNTYQHLDERINESLIDTRQPFYGTLKWTFHDKITREAYRFAAISGILYGNPGKVEFMDFDVSSLIENIVLETVDRKQETEINISQLNFDFIEIVRKIEKELEKQIAQNGMERNNWTSRQDIIMKFKRSKPTTEN